MGINKLFRVQYNKIIQSIAFYPAVIAIGFLLLSWGMLEVDFSQWGKTLKSNQNWISLKDASTARSIVSTVAGAIITLTVFSFSMVMIVLNQAASQMSNRVLSSMIENRFQQIVLGFYIGTIVYALSLLSTIRDVNSGIQVPALSIYLLILITIIDIFLFIYFLNYVTQTVRYETVIHRVQKQAMTTMKNKFEDIENRAPDWRNLPNVKIGVPESNYFQSYIEKQLLDLACEHNVRIRFCYQQSTYLIKGTLFMQVFGKDVIEDEFKKELLTTINFFIGQPIEMNPDYGFHQLAEVALKALSPGINDPETAVLSLHALSDLLSYRLYRQLPSLKKDSNDEPRIYVPTSSFQEIFEKCIHPIWHYGKSDQYIQDELVQMIEQLKMADHKKLYTGIFDKLLKKVEEHQKAAIAEY